MFRDQTDLLCADIYFPPGPAAKTRRAGQLREAVLEMV